MNGASANKESRAQAQLQVAEDMNLLIKSFADDSAMNTRSTYPAVVRLFGYHCEFKDKKVSVRPKAQDASGQSAQTMQNPSDAAGGYSGHSRATRLVTRQTGQRPARRVRASRGGARIKGPGYQVRLSETSAKANPVQIITGCLPPSAGNQDTPAVEPMLEQLQGNEMLPGELAADTAYGSDENH